MQLHHIYDIILNLSFEQLYLLTRLLIFIVIEFETHSIAA